MMRIEKHTMPCRASDRGQSRGPSGQVGTEPRHGATDTICADGDASFSALREVGRSLDGYRKRNRVRPCFGGGRGGGGGLGGGGGGGSE